MLHQLTFPYIINFKLLYVVNFPCHWMKCAAILDGSFYLHISSLFCIPQYSGSLDTVFKKHQHLTNNTGQPILSMLSGATS